MGEVLRAPPDPLGPDAWNADELDRRGARRRIAALFVNVFVVAICGLVYELLAGAVASYLLGDSVTQFSLIIGVYLSAMGVGAWLSRFVVRDLARRFVDVELLVALVGGTSAPALFFAFGSAIAFRPLLFLEVFLIGALVGLELPLLMRILEGELQFKDLVSRTLAFDYAGALVASILFPIVLMPRLGMVRTALVIGIVNAAIALWGTRLLYGHIGPRAAGLRARAVVVAVVLFVGLVKAETLTELAEERVYADPLLTAKSTPYQRIVVTGGASGFALWLNGNLQLASADEYRYHEALVHPAMASVTSPRRVLVLGGGDGCALREIAKYEQVESITLVDLDQGMTDLARTFAPLAALNAHAYDDPRLTLVHDDAFVWLDERRPDDPKFDVVVVDFPDPNNLSLGKLYTRHFYQRLRAALADDGAVVVQSTSPLQVRRSFWTIATTLEAAGFAVHAMHTPVPSFGEWGFALARKHAFAPPARVADAVRGELRYLDDATLASLFVLSTDMARVPADVNRLDNQVLVRVYEQEAATALR